MSDIEIHTVILQPEYAAQHIQWLDRFVFQIDMPKIPEYFFSCFSYQVFETGLVEFVVLVKGGDKSNAVRQHVLLPFHAVAAILLDDSRKNQFGFHQEQSHGSSS